MIERSMLPSWSEIFIRLGESCPHRSRARCPIHNGDSPTSLSVNEDRGIFHCFVCGAAGDKVDFVQQVLGCDFKAALRFLGLEPGQQLPPVPAMQRQNKIRKGLKRWAYTLQRKLRDEFFLRSRMEYWGKHRLEKNPEDHIGWEMLSIAYRGISLDELEHHLDLLIGTEAQKLEAYREWKGAS